jgi:hypothetical protein
MTKPGYFADVVICDPKVLKDSEATREKPGRVVRGPAGRVNKREVALPIADLVIVDLTVDFR